MVMMVSYPIFSTESALAFFESVVCGPMIAVWAFHGVIVKHLLRQQVSLLLKNVILGFLRTMNQSLVISCSRLL